MLSAQADELGRQAAALALSGDAAGAVALISQHTAERNAFAMLDRAGRLLGRASLALLDPVIDGLAASGAEGAWPVIGSALAIHLADEMPGVLARTRALIAGAGLWYPTDILGERVPGAALVAGRPDAQAALSAWRFDADRWVRRAVGVAVHLWAKRRAGLPGGEAGCLALMEYLRPMLGERQFDAAKGVGWAFKTMGRYRPATATAWLLGVLQEGRARPGGVVMRKAVTYLPEASRLALMSSWRQRGAGSRTAGRRA